MDNSFKSIVVEASGISANHPLAAVLAGRTAARAAVEELMLRKQRPEPDDIERVIPARVVQ